MENPIKVDDLGGKTHYFRFNIHILYHKKHKAEDNKNLEKTHIIVIAHSTWKKKRKNNKQTSFSLSLSCLLKISSRTDWAGAELWEMEMVALTGLSVLPFCNWPIYLQYCKNLNHGDFEFFGAILALKTMLNYVGL